MFVNLYHIAKIEVLSSICLRDIVKSKILKSDWLREFWDISQEQDFSRYGICAETQQIISILIIKQTQ